MTLTSRPSSLPISPMRKVTSAHAAPVAFAPAAAERSSSGNIGHTTGLAVVGMLVHPQIRVVARVVAREVATLVGCGGLGNLVGDVDAFGHFAEHAVAVVARVGAAEASG